MLLESCIEGLNLPNSTFSFTEHNCPNPENRAQFNQNGPRKSIGEHFLRIIKLFCLLARKRNLWRHVAIQYFARGVEKLGMAISFQFLLFKVKFHFYYFNSFLVSSALIWGRFHFAKTVTPSKDFWVAWEEKYYGKKKLNLQFLLRRIFYFTTVRKCFHHIHMK